MSAELGKPFMKPGTKVKARRFGREILAKVTASGGSTFTVVALNEDDYTVWQDMTFDDVTIVDESGIAVGARVHSDDYGDGTVVLDLGDRVQVVWDEPMTGTFDHHALLHDRDYVEKLKRLK